MNRGKFWRHALAAFVSLVPAASLLVATSAPLLATGCGGDCELHTCAEWCEGLGEPADPSASFETCLEGVGTYGSDFVLLDDEGEEVYRCEYEKDELGQEIGSCSYDFAVAKSAYCGC
jgi:hypothetical protein